MCSCDALIFSIVNINETDDGLDVTLTFSQNK